MDTLPIWVVDIPADEELEARTKGLGFKRPDVDAMLKHISVDAMQQSLAGVARAIGTALGDIKAVGDFELREVTIQAEISASGGVNLVGTATAGGKGAITLKFSREQ